MSWTLRNYKHFVLKTIFFSQNENEWFFSFMENWNKIKWSYRSFIVNINNLLLHLILIITIIINKWRFLKGKILHFSFKKL